MHCTSANSNQRKHTKQGVTSDMFSWLQREDPHKSLTHKPLMQATKKHIQTRWSTVIAQQRQGSMLAC